MNEHQSPLAQAIEALYSRAPTAQGAQTGVAYAKAVARQASDAAAKVGPATYRAMKDTTKTESARKVAAARAAISATKDSRAALNKARQNIAQDAAVIRTRLTALERTSSEDAAIVAEIRNHFHGLKTTSAKLERLEQAKAAGDSLTLKAILAGPAYLSGMAPDLVQHLREDFHKTEAPEDVAHLNNLNESFEVINEIDSAMTSLVGEFNTREVQGLMQIAKDATSE